jgi:uncharacterized phosphatase
MKHLYFVRHGVSIMNRTGFFSGRTETPLHEDGRDQARTAGKQLKDKKIIIDCIVSSPLSRTYETAQLIAQEIGYPEDKILTNDLLMERDFGPLEGSTYKPDLGDVEGVESIESVIQRGQQALEYLKTLPYDNVLVVSHGATGRALRTSLDPSIPFRPSKGFDNAELVQLL